MAIHCGRQNATITHFVKFMTTFFSVAHCGGNVVSHGPHESRTHRGIEQTVSKTNSFIRQFCAAPSIEDWPIRKQCRGHDSSFMSFTQFFSHLRAHAIARYVTVARSSAVQASSSRRQEWRWTIVCSSPQSQSTDWASSR